MAGMCRLLCIAYIPAHVAGKAWPLTPTFGAVGGFIVGSLAALVVSATLELAQAGREAQPLPSQPADRKSKRS